MRDSQATQKPSDARDRILRAADTLFYGHGINSVGVDAIAAAAGVTKRTLYHHFESKDALVAAYVGAHTSNFRIDPDRSAREQILRAFEKLSQRLADDGFRGCAFINAAAELSDRKHPAVVVATNAKDAREAWFRDLAKQGHATQPELLAKQLAILFDGTIAQFLVRRDRAVAHAAIAAAEALTIDLA